ncbi:MULTISPECIES: SGNH/GDSL hydrolase family protein [Arthrobacter]|uniref:SGNH/GDSL hydrolase family protein n=1 Tax=Arthrobacter TaxID=1663 RepID=UPI0012B61788|nr:MULTISPECIES: SGNH/GDSL hydrolase family protein [Arthrobacter]
MAARAGWSAITRRFHWQGRSTVLLSMIAVLLVVVSGAAAYAAAPAIAPVKAVQLDVIGDSLSTGFRTPGDTWPAQAQTIATSMGLKVGTANASENGAGYATPGETGDVFLDLVNRVVNSQSQVVVIFGSDNDTGASGLAQAVQSTLARVKVLAPDATVILVGPTSESDDPQGNLTVIRQTLEQQAADTGARFVDPVSLGWFQGAAAQDLASDLEHPNTAGETYLAEHMTAIMAPSVKSAMYQDQLARAGTHVQANVKSWNLMNQRLFGVPAAINQSGVAGTGNRFRIRRAGTW